MRSRFSLATRLIVAFLAVLGCAAGCAQQTRALPTLPGVARTCPGLGRAQGVAVHRSMIYLFGDAETGIVREYGVPSTQIAQLNPTGRVIRLTRDGTNVLNHPTGLALHDALPCFLGNTVTATREGRIYQIDLARALLDGTLDHAILNETLDDLAVQGSRPEYVRAGDRFLIATSDYGPGPNYVRFYDPMRLAAAPRTSAPGVLVRSIPCGPWVQSLHWVDETGTLVIVQNVTEGRRWRLTLVSDLDAWDYRSGPGASG